MSRVKLDMCVGVHSDNKGSLVRRPGFRREAWEQRALYPPKTAAAAAAAAAGHRDMHMSARQPAKEQLYEQHMAFSERGERIICLSLTTQC